MKKSLDAFTSLAISLEPRREAIDQLLRGDPLALGLQRHRLAELVGAGEEEDVLPALAHVAGEDVDGHGRVRVARDAAPR